MTGPHRLAQPATIAADTVIIGSGAGGSCVADVLTSANRDVVMVESGPFIDSEHAPRTLAQSFATMYRCGGITPAIGRPPISYVEGKCVGGSTEINSAIFQPAPPELIENWAGIYGIRDFDAQSLRPYYERAREIVNASFTPQPLGQASDILRRGAEALHWECQELQRGQRDCVGTNMCAHACPTGAKQSMTNTLIPKSLSRGMRLIAECQVRRLRVRGGRVTVAHAKARGPDGNWFPVRLRGDHFFVCAGAIQTAALLRRSGITQNVGNSLRIHPTIRMTARFDDPVDAHLARLPLYAVTQFMPHQRLGGSLFTPSLFAMTLAEDWAHRKNLMEHWRYAALYYAMIRAVGCGTVRPWWGDAEEPLVRYTLGEIDWRRLGEAVGRIGELLLAAGARQVFPGVVGHQGWTRSAQCREFVCTPLPRAKTTLSTIHLFGSCPPGEERVRTATDSFGRVRGLQNLFLADASQIPEAPGVNPQATVMAIGFRNAEAFLAHSPMEHRRDVARED